MRHPRRCPSRRAPLACRRYPSYKSAGNYGVPAMTQDPAKLAELELAELKHGAPRYAEIVPDAAEIRALEGDAWAECRVPGAGRLAMVGIISFACAAAIPGSVPLYPF